LRSVPASALVAVRIVVTGRLLVSLVGARQIREPRPDSRPLFRGVAQDKLSFRVTTSEADDYLVILSNRAGKEPVTVEAQIRVLRRSPKPRSETRAALDPGGRCGCRDSVA
jgi:hypothetical protein